MMMRARCKCLVLLLGFMFCARVVRGSLDPVYGPRDNKESGQITSLERQLLDAVLMGDTKLLNITNLITAGTDPNCYDEYHMTPLHWAVVKGQRLAVELLLTRGSHTDVRDSSYRTPMHYVAIYGWGTEFPSVLTALYFAGANFNAADQSGNTPLHLAAMENQVPTLLELIKYGAKLNWANTWQQRTALGMAMLTGNTEAEAALKAAGATQPTVTFIPGCTNPPCRGYRLDTPTEGQVLAGCTNDRSNLELGANAWGCGTNNHFMQEQPVIEPQPPGPPRKGQQLNIIQGTCIS